MAIDKNIRLYYLSSIFEGLRFLVPVWLLWYTRFIPISTVGLVESIGILISMVLEVPTGAFADIVGRRKSILIGKMGVSLAAFIVAFATNGTNLIIGVVIWGISGAFISGSNTALIYDHLLSQGKENLFSKISANAATISRIGIIVGSFCGGFLYNLWGPLPYFLFGITNIIEASIWYFVEEPSIDSVHFSWQKYLQMIQDGFRAISHSPYVRLISAISIVAVSFAAIFREYLNYSFAIDLGLNAESQSLLFGTSGILKILSVVIIGHLIVRHSQNKIIFTYLLALSVTLLVTFFSGFTGGIVILLLIETITATAPIISDTYINRELKSSDRATANSFINMFVSLVYALGVYLGMYFSGIFKSPIVFSSFGVILLVISFVFLFIRNKNHSGIASI